MRKTVIVAIHGFGGLRCRDFDAFASIVKEEGIEFYTFELFDGIREPDWTSWVERAYRGVKYYTQRYEVILMGFSMGGVIAGYLASRLPIKKLILVSPAYYYIGIDNAYRYIKKMAAIASEGEAEIIQYIEERFLDSDYVKEFIKLIHYLRHQAKSITIPTLILQGTKDEIVPVLSSWKMYQDIASKQKERYLIDRGTHEILRNPLHAHQAYIHIMNFLEH